VSGDGVAWQVVWTRLRELCKTPMRIFPVKQDPSEVVPGALKATWLHTAMAMVVSQPKLLQKLMLNTEHADLGIYVVKLFDLRAGCWTPVLIDDRIPCDSVTGEAFFTHSPDRNRRKTDKGHALNLSSWTMLVEKACAKLVGSYEALLNFRGGVDAGLQMLTGGAVSEGQGSGTGGSRIEG